MSVSVNPSEDREARLKELDLFIANSKENLTSIVSRLGWTLESVTKNIQNYVVCPFDKSHRVPERSLDKHLQECQWKAEGYGEQDLPLSCPSLPPGAPSSLKFDEQLQDAVIQSAKQKNPTMATGPAGRLIPRTSDRLMADFTREEKCALYEYVIVNTVEPDIGEDIADINKPKASNSGGKSSYLELLAQERNLKRRRAKYRGVHTNKKSQIEILREVVNQQMEMLSEYISEKQNEIPESSTICSPAGKSQSDFLQENKHFPVEDDRRSRRSETSDFRYRSLDDRRESHGERDKSADSKIFSRNSDRNGRKDRPESADRKSHKSSHKKRRSRDRRRSKSRDKDKKQRSRDRRENREERRDDRRRRDRSSRKRSRSRSDGIVKPRKQKNVE